MLRIYAEAFVTTGRRLSEFQSTIRYGASGPISAGDAATIVEQLDAFLVSLEKLQLATTEGIIRRYRPIFADPPHGTYERAAACAEAIETAIKTELTQRLFLQVPSERSKLMLQPLRDWVNLGKAFPDSAQDAGEASVCLALERPIACVFHLMRVAEHGIRAVGISLNSTMQVEKLTWGEILRPCEDELAKKPADRVSAWAQDEDYFRDVVMNLRSLQKAVRDPTMHVRKEYTVEKAATVYDATRAFMVHAAEKLHHP